MSDPGSTPDSAPSSAANSAASSAPDTDFDDNPYDLLARDDDAARRWAFGTGFTDPLDGTDPAVPAGVDPGQLARCCLALGDDALIYSHRLQQWVTRMPELEEETALANIALDLLGQARMLLSRAGMIIGRGEDELAFFRAEGEFRNVRLAEHADRDFAELTVRLLLLSTWRLALFESLAGRGPGAGTASASAADPVLAAIAAKGVYELAYHRDYAAGWVIRLGDGTALSHAKAQAAVDTLWPLAAELFRPDPDALPVPAGTAVPASIAGRAAFDAIVDSVLDAAGLHRPPKAPAPPAAPPAPPAAPPAPAGERAGRDGEHTAAMAGLLAELQSVARAHPDATW